MITEQRDDTRRRLARIINTAEGKLLHSTLFYSPHVLTEILESLNDWQAELGGDATDAGGDL